MNTFKAEATGIGYIDPEGNLKISGENASAMLDLIKEKISEERYIFDFPARITVMVEDLTVTPNITVQ